MFSIEVVSIASSLTSSMALLVNFGNLFAALISALDKSCSSDVSHHVFIFDVIFEPYVSLWPGVLVSVPLETSVAISVLV